MARATAAGDRKAAHWKLLSLLPGAPECVIKAAHLAQIQLHHPDRGGDAEMAKRINVAYDELRGSGSAANEYVAANFNGQPWAVLGISSAADPALAERAARQLSGELSSHQRLADRVRWALDHFGSVQPERVRPVSAPPPPRPPLRRSPPAPTPTRPAMPEGLPARIDFERVEWGSPAAVTIQLTWRHAPPYGLTIDTPEPITAEVSSSKVKPGRFSVAFSVDWDSPALATGPTVRGHTISGDVRIRWTSEASTLVPVRGTILYPAIVTASPPSLDLGSVDHATATRVSLVVVSTAGTSLSVEPPAWLERVDGAGRVLKASDPIGLRTNIPVRLEFRVAWAPITERARASFAQDKPVRPTGRILLRWDGNETAVQAQIVVAPPRPARR